MTSKKGPAQQEPFLNTVARKIGYAAGTLTNAAQELTENISGLPESVSTKMRQAASTIAPANRSVKKKSRSAAAGRTRKTVAAVQNMKRKPAGSQSSRSRRKSTKSKNKK